MMVEPSSSELQETFSSRSQRPFVLENSGVVLNDELARTIPHGMTVRLHDALHFKSPDDTAKRLRGVLNDYFSPGTYSIGSLAQITKFSEGRWAMWDGQGDDNRLFAYIPFQDMCIRQKSHLTTVTRGSIVLCSPLCPALYMIPACRECIVLGLPIKGNK
ncbi:uncharacterized protein BDV17DRAFT_244684 [Aspergillus undulatus]|uniref:uncharacterized protein n=1 Tax=Aspergillus undulatus TaxID=1810928 RepID=UPI003CCDA334